MTQIEKLIKDAHSCADKAIKKAETRLQSKKDWLLADWSGLKNWHKIAAVALLVLAIWI
jgi:vacuolar-type H+-ATPase subunit H